MRNIQILLPKGLGKMEILADFEKRAKRTNDSTYQTSFNSSKIAGFRTCENLIFRPLFPLVGRVGKMVFGITWKAVKSAEVAKAFLQWK